MSRADRGLLDQEVNDAFERINPPCGGNRGSQVRIGIDVVEDSAAIVCFQVLDAANVEACRTLGRATTDP